MRVEALLNIIGADFYTGIPDSQLKPLCDYLMRTYGTEPCRHIIGANEGNCVALAAGYHLATKKVPVVYMQNSGEGNAINPIASLLNHKVYGIPVIFIIGWRGEPGQHDEPQHLYQGSVTLKLLEDMDVDFFVVRKETEEKEAASAMMKFRSLLSGGKSAAFVICKEALSYEGRVSYGNGNHLIREEALRHIVKSAQADPLISTTGKISRELYDIREEMGQGHGHDFLTVGSMGHCSSIALGIAIHKPHVRVWCIDGDGAVLMHMGALALIGTSAPKNLIHIVMNNEAHETVGGMPTVGGKIDMVSMAKACGYPNAVRVGDADELDRALEEAKGKKELCLIEVRCAVGSRMDLGRPKTAAQENKQRFMEYLDGPGHEI